MRRGEGWGEKGGRFGNDKVNWNLSSQCAGVRKIVIAS